MAKVWVPGYTKSDGTKVKGYYRSAGTKEKAMPMWGEMKNAPRKVKKAYRFNEEKSGLARTTNLEGRARMSVVGGSKIASSYTLRKLQGAKSPRTKSASLSKSMYGRPKRK